MQNRYPLLARDCKNVKQRGHFWSVYWVYTLLNPSIIEQKMSFASESGGPLRTKTGWVAFKVKGNYFII